MSAAFRPAYEDDFFAWTADQAARLRTLASERPNQPVDLDLIAEEIEDLGRSELHAVASFTQRIIEHLLKLEYAAADRDRAHWKREIIHFRLQARRKLTPSIRAKVELEFAELYRGSVALAAAALEESDPEFSSRLPPECPYTLDEVLSDPASATAARK